MDGDENIKQMKERLERLRHMRLNHHDALDSSKNIVMRAVQQEYPDLGRQDAERVTRELVLAPKQSSIKIGDKEVPVADLQFHIAMSIEALGSETSSEEEYFSWFTESSEIIQRMNDGFVSKDDLAERNKWLETSYAREAELMTCLGLFQSSAFPEARERYNSLYNKLVKLRQIRSSIRETTANKTDEQKEVDLKQKEDAYKKAVVYVAATREFLKRQPRWNMSRRTLLKLNIYHGNDDELRDDYDDFYGIYDNDIQLQDELYQEENSVDNVLSFRFDDELKKDILFHWDDDRMPSYDRSLAEELFARAGNIHQEKSKEDIRERIARLSGRRPSLNSNSPGYNMNRVRAFDHVYYNSLASRRQNA